MKWTQVTTACLLAAEWVMAADGSARAVAGRVCAGETTVPGAVVRVPGTALATVTDAKGRFKLELPTGSESVDLSACAEGFFIGGAKLVRPGSTDLRINLKPCPHEDNPAYQWVSAFAQENDPLNCQRCMSSGDKTGALPFDEWQRDAHSQSAVNPRFLSMYNGADVQGRRGPLTRYILHRDYGRIPLRADPDKPYYGPGYKLDFETAGNCAACHLPTAAIDAPYETDPNLVTGVGREGATCDFCHKVRSVRLEAETGLPFRNMPGVMSFEFLRPPVDSQVFLGPYDDVPGHSVHAPAQSRSEFCAPCHFGVFWNITIYNSFGEWLASPYADPKKGKTCQDCHMPRAGLTRFVRLPPDSGRVARDRDPHSIFGHAMPGASDPQLLRNALTLKATARRADNRLVLRIVITNDKTGHHVPTDSPLRQVLLLIRAGDTTDRPLRQLDGPVLPDWCGVGESASGNYAGLPGKAYAKLLMELWTETFPTAAYWNQTRLLADNRIAAFASDESTYVFAAPDQGLARLRITLLFRRAFKQLADQKGWNTPDILMDELTIVL
jgi:hypothetical protein